MPTLRLRITRGLRERHKLQPTNMRIIKLTHILGQFDFVLKCILMKVLTDWKNVGPFC